MKNKKIKIYLGMALYSLLYTIPKNYVPGKMGRKNILKLIKKKLKVYSLESKNEYSKMVGETDTILENTLVSLNKEDLRYLNPGAIIKILHNNYQSYFSYFGINSNYVKNISDAYIIPEVNNTFISIKYTNALIKEIEKTIKDK